MAKIVEQLTGCRFISGLGVSSMWPIQGLIWHFRPEMERRIAKRQGSGMLEAAE